MSAFALALHALFATIWVGGMFFAYLVLRPSVPGIEPPPERLKLWSRVFPKFFHWVWIAVLILPLSGYWLMMDVFGGFAGSGPHIHLMHLTGWVMIALFAALYFIPYRSFKTAVSDEDWPGAVAKLDTIRKIVGINLVLGLITLLAGASGRLWPGF
jgi:uncharacterized membrane protein